MKKVALVGQTVATQLFVRENPVGKTIKINRKNFTVIGVLPMKGAAGFQDQDDTVIVPLRTAMKVLLGILMGSGASLLLSKFSGWAIYISPFSVVLAFGFSAGVGIVFGFWPAKKASLLSPIDALRYE